MRWSLVSAAVLSAGLAGAAIGQPERPGNEAPLAGPKVRERRVPGVQQDFSETRRDGARGRAGQGVPHRAFMRAIEGLRGEGEHAAPEEIRLTADQNDQIDRIDREFRETMREHVEKTRPQGAAPGRPKRDRAADGADAAEMPAPEADREAARQRVAEARRNAPKAAECHTRMYSVLTEPQRDYMNGRLDEWRKQAEERFGQEYMQRRLRERGAAPGAPPPPEGAPPPGEGRERLRRIAERLAQLPPEERDRILNRLEQELERRLGERRDEAGPEPKAPQPAGPRPGR